jgi:hypothetical protein
MHTKTDTLYNAGCGDDPAPGGIPRTRLAWLCQPEQIEQTLHLLSSLNHWAKARERLLYADRQGLYRVKAAVVRQTFASGMLRPVAYIDGSAGFAAGFSLDLAADIATEVFIERLAMLIEDDVYLPDDEDEIDSVVLRLFARITGRRPGSRADIEALDVEGTKAFLQERLAALVARARSSRQPIPDSELAALCVEPVDLLDVRWSRSRPSPRWCELDEREVVQFDPEGLSLIAFQYLGTTAHFIFHLPFRVAEGFVPEPLVRDLRSRPGESREGGEFFGRAITEAEGRQHPLEDILRELGVDVAAVCPFLLADKQQYISQRARRYPYWEGDEEDDVGEDDWGDEDGEPSSRLEGHRHKGELAPGTCSLCGIAVEPDPSQRIEHWQQHHDGQDLTASQVAWLLLKSKSEVKSPSAAIQPDYRGPLPPLGGNGTRFWRLETLAAAVSEGQQYASGN